MAQNIEDRRVKIGIIGGSGLEDPSILEDQKEKFVKTPFGDPSDALLCGRIGGVEHGRKHSVSPTNVNYRANVWALDAEGCTHILATNTCGSLEEDIQPGQIVFVDQFIDRTTRRVSTFYDGSSTHAPGVCHVPMAGAYCARTRQVLVDTAKELKLPHHTTGTMVCIEGPRFSSRAESLMYRLWGGTVIGMTAVPEVCLAAERALCYASIAMPTDYDSWRGDGHESVNVDLVMKTFAHNNVMAINLIRAVIPKLAAIDWTDTLRANREVVLHSNMSK